MSWKMGKHTFAGFGWVAFKTHLFIHYIIHTLFPPNWIIHSDYLCIRAMKTAYKCTRSWAACWVKCSFHLLARLWENPVSRPRGQTTGAHTNLMSGIHSQDMYLLRSGRWELGFGFHHAKNGGKPTITAPSAHASAGGYKTFPSNLTMKMSMLPNHISAIIYISLDKVWTGISRWGYP